MNPDRIKFDDRGLVAAVAQDRLTLRVLMLAWMNREAVEKTLETGKAHYWSRSRGELWLKGETSGNVQHVRSVHYDCDADALLLVVDPAGPACHTGEETCFYRDAERDETASPSGTSVLTDLGEVLKERKGAEAGKSYVASLYAGGVEKIGGKVREEAEELIEAAAEKDDKEVVHEAADLLFHAMVMLAHRDVDIKEVFRELDRRFGTSGHEEKASRKRAGSD